MNTHAAKTTRTPPVDALQAGIEAALRRAARKAQEKALETQQRDSRHQQAKPRHSDISRHE